MSARPELGKTCSFAEGDLRDYEFVERTVRDFRPDAIVHFGEQRSALLAGVIGYRNTLAAEAAWRDSAAAPAGTPAQPAPQPAPTPVTEGSRDLQG